MNHSTPGLPVHHQLPEFTKVQVLQNSLRQELLLLLLLLSRFSHVQLCATPEMAVHQALPGILQARTLEWLAISVNA